MKRSCVTVALSVPRINIHVTYSSRELGYPGYIHEDNVFTAATCLDTSAKVTRASNSIFPSVAAVAKITEIYIPVVLRSY